MIRRAASLGQLELEAFVVSHPAAQRTFVHPAAFSRRADRLLREERENRAFANRLRSRAVTMIPVASLRFGEVRNVNEERAAKRIELLRMALSHIRRYLPLDLCSRPAT